MKAFLLFIVSFYFSFFTASAQSTPIEQGPYLKKTTGDIIVWVTHPSSYSDSSDIIILDRRVHKKGISKTGFTVTVRGQQFNGAVSEKLWDRKKNLPEPLYVSIGFTISKITIKPGPIVLASPLSAKKKVFTCAVEVDTE